MGGVSSGATSIGDSEASSTAAGSAASAALRCQASSGIRCTARTSAISGSGRDDSGVVGIADVACTGTLWRRPDGPGPVAALATRSGATVEDAGDSGADVAAMLATPVGTVKWRVSEARRQLRVKLTRLGF